MATNLHDLSSCSNLLSNVAAADLQPVYLQIDGKKQLFKISRSWSILQCKHMVAQRLETDVENIHFIFAGARLDDIKTVDSYSIDTLTTMHVIVLGNQPTKTSDIAIEYSTTNVGHCFEGVTATVPQESKEHHFYVYCKDVCRKPVCKGKLRVRCGKCKNISFTLNQGPNSWDDVMKTKLITGKCLSMDCEGTFAQFFLKCAEHTSAQCEESDASPLNLVCSNLKAIPCLGCMDVRNPILVFPCQDRHVICLPCFQLFVTTSLDQRHLFQAPTSTTIGYTMHCPGGRESCLSSYIDDAHHFRIAGDEQYARYQRFSAEEFLLENGGVFCPGNGCGNGIIAGLSRRISCDRMHGGCGFIFCKFCRNAFHDGSCPKQLTEEQLTNSNNALTISAEALQMARWNLESEDIIRKTAKRCPNIKCQVPIQKSGGCNHMVCTRCKFNWCWPCEKEWNEECRSSHWFFIDL